MTGTFTLQQARLVIVIGSIGITSTLMLVLLFAPLIGIPFNYERGEHMRLIETTLPIFTGYLAAAAHFVFSDKRPRIVRDENSSLLFALTVGPLATFVIIVGCLFLAFCLRNRPGSGGGMDIEELSRFFSFALAFLTASVGVVSGYVFGGPSKR